MGPSLHLVRLCSHVLMHWLCGEQRSAQHLWTLVCQGGLIVSNVVWTGVSR